jgi:hypothetical protein
VFPYTDHPQWWGVPVWRVVTYSWLACLLADPVGRRTALVLVLHHVLADGLGGLAILAALADPGI